MPRGERFVKNRVMKRAHELLLISGFSIRLPPNAIQKLSARSSWLRREIAITALQYLWAGGAPALSALSNIQLSFI